MRPLVLLLAASCALAVGCSGGDDDDDDDGASGVIDVTVDCSGPACGLTGSLKVPVHADTCGASALITISVPAVTASSNGELVTVSGLESGSSYCLEAWLDADANGTLDSGDAIASSGGQTANAGASAVLDFTLDALQP